MYPACDWGEGKTGSTGWGLFDQESVPGVASWRPMTRSFAAFGEIAQTAPMLLPATAAPADQAAFTVLAGRSLNQQHFTPAVVRVLVGAQAKGATAGFSTVALAVEGLAPAKAATWSYTVSSLTASAEWGVVAQGVASVPVGGAASVSFPMVAPAVAFVRMEQVGGERERPAEAERQGAADGR
jgi:hypothetical protein